MEKSTLTECLMEFGLTRQEANIYLCLLTEGKQSGYEVAKSTGISRSNTYGALANLTEKGAAYLSEEGTARKYVALEPEEFCGNYIRRLEQSRRWIAGHMPDSRREEEGYITIEGAVHIADKIHNLLLKARERVYISCTVSMLPLFRGDLEGLSKQGKKVVVITDRYLEMPGIKVYVCEPKECQIGVIADSRYALTGEMGEGSSNTCLYSGQKNFVQLYKKALANEIKIINYKKGE